MPRPGVLDSPRRVERFLREARAAAQLPHPNIVPIFDAGQDAERHYIAAAFIKGKLLAEAVDGQPMECRRAAQIVRALAEAAGYAHALGIVHRDIKPANVMLDEKDQPLLMDFGLAARADENEKLTQDGAVLGTPAYMAPEQAVGQQGEAQPASDQYSLGVLLYELLTGRTPFAGPPQVVLFNAVNTAPPPPRTLCPEIPQDLEAVCLQAMAKNPDDRYPNCQELAVDLGRWLDDEFVQARRPANAERFRKWRKRNPRLAAAVFSIAAVLLLASGGAVVYAGKARGDASLARDRAESLAQEVQGSLAIAEDTRTVSEERVRDAETRRAEERGRSERLRYAQHIKQAHQDWRDGNLDRARFHLDAARWDLCN